MLLLDDFLGNDSYSVLFEAMDVKFEYEFDFNKEKKFKP